MIPKLVLSESEILEMALLPGQVVAGGVMCCPWCLLYPETIDLPVRYVCDINSRWVGAECFWCGRVGQYSKAEHYGLHHFLTPEYENLVYRKPDIPGPPPPPMPHVDESMSRYTKYPY